MNGKDIIYRLSFRAGYLAGLGWPFNWFVRDVIYPVAQPLRKSWFCGLYWKRCGPP